jgi:hypothetical protein
MGALLSISEDEGLICRYVSISGSPALLRNALNRKHEVPSVPLSMILN